MVPLPLEEDGLVIVKESGARYMVVDGTLHLAANTTSAQLYFNGATNVRQVPQEEIDHQEIGAPLGIYGAPDSPPGPGRLVTTGWSACADGEQMTTYVDDEAPVAEAAAETAALVEVDGTTWLLASRARNATVQVRGRPTDQLPRDARERAAVASMLRYAPGESDTMMNDYLRTARRAHAVVDRVFWE